jgi:hypothetical protein
MFRLYWKYYVQALLKVLCSGFTESIMFRLYWKYYVQTLLKVLCSGFTESIMFRLYWKYYVQALLKVLCSGFAVIQVLYSLSKKDLIRMSYPINMAFWLDNFGVRVWNTLKFRNCEARTDSLALMLLPCFSIIITNSALEYIKFTMESKSIKYMLTQ